MNISLKSKNALVGGSSKGLGNAVARQLALSGAKVTLVARSKDLLVDTVNELNKLTECKHEYLICDYNDHEKYSKIISQYLSCLLYTSPSPRDQRGSRMPSCG